MPSPIYHQQTRSVEVATKITHHTHERRTKIRENKQNCIYTYEFKFIVESFLL